ncbi:hypothetical protein FP76_gp160 [Bacillus phage Evoli]|uniref:Uncharacterized protein n=1 Tax=Bacillus phage Evoli TaxID=1486658 RepID=A0A024AZY2_9CAUD|nr:hypothetical protein FP76_gp160 [Bacillus phage Evoli]AHZ09934.1 hypothetical protein [Bacillus phage Evoli]
MNKETNLIKVPVTITDEGIQVAEAMAELQAKAHELGESLDIIYGVEKGKNEQISEEQFLTYYVYV